MDTMKLGTKNGVSVSTKQVPGGVSVSQLVALNTAYTFVHRLKYRCDQTLYKEEIISNCFISSMF